jgi:hypothetical protein
MATPHTSASPCAHCGQDERTARQLRTLADLAQAGMDLVFELRRQVQAAGAGEALAANPFVGDPMLAFARASRAVRLTLALETRIAEADALAQTSPEAWMTRARRRDFAKTNRDEVEGAVRIAIATEAGERGEGHETERLAAELREKLDETDEAFWLDGRPVASRIAEVCRDLGVRFDPALWDAEEGTYNDISPFTDPDDDDDWDEDDPNPAAHHSAHPGDCRGPDHETGLTGFRPGQSPTDPPPAPSDLDPGIRRDEREEGNEMENIPP